MAASANCDSVVLGKFHPNCGKAVNLSKDRGIASGYYTYAFCVAFSNDPIPIGLKFSVKILQHNSLPVWLSIGVTTKHPDNEPVPQDWVDINNSDKYWYILIGNGEHTANHNGASKALEWDLNISANNTFACCVVETGEFHLYYNGRDVGVALEGLPTDQPLWGFVTLCGLKVQADYIIARGHPYEYASKILHFVETPPERLICVVCKALPRDPVQANCCGVISCTHCMERKRTESGCCPACRNTEHSNPAFNVFIDRNALHCIAGLVVYCPNQCDGCDQRINLSQVDNHLNSDNGCAVHVVNCGNECGHRESRATMQKHMESECRLRKKKCQYCPFTSTHERVTGVHLGMCPNYPLDCPNNCGTDRLTRSTVSAHTEVCLLQQVECEYRQFGCAAAMQRKFVQDHQKTSMHSHLQMTRKKVEEQAHCLDDQEARLQAQELRIQDQELHIQGQDRHIKGLEERLLKLETTLAHLADK